MKRNDCLKELKWRAALLTTLTLIAMMALVFFLFCFIEAFGLLFTHGSFTFTLPAIATAFATLAFLVFALVGGGAR
jgi:hypothetical protein